jgi:hypothetical protein
MALHSHFIDKERKTQRGIRFNKGKEQVGIELNKILLFSPFNLQLFSRCSKGDRYVVLCGIQGVDLPFLDIPHFIKVVLL